MSKFVIVKFNDGDYRVYTKRVANKRAVRAWSGGNHHIHAEVVAENKDKDVLISMATLARHDYMEAEGLTLKEDDADYTGFGAFP